MSGLRARIGGEGQVVAEYDRSGWRLIARGHPQAKGFELDGLHAALRTLALSERDLARDAFGVVCNCPGAWEDEYTEEHGEDALTFEDWMERIARGGATRVNDEGELETSS